MTPLPLLLPLSVVVLVALGLWCERQRNTKVLSLLGGLLAVGGILLLPQLFVGTIDALHRAHSNAVYSMFLFLLMSGLYCTDYRTFLLLLQTPSGLRRLFQVAALGAGIALQFLLLNALQLVFLPRTPTAVIALWFIAATLATILIAAGLHLLLPAPADERDRERNYLRRLIGTRLLVCHFLALGASLLTWLSPSSNTFLFMFPFSLIPMTVSCHFIGHRDQKTYR